MSCITMSNFRAFLIASIIFGWMPFFTSSFSPAVVAPFISKCGQTKLQQKHLSASAGTRQQCSLTTKAVLKATADADEDGRPSPQSFREAEVLGLRLMQQGEHTKALEVFQQGLKLPGSRTDVIRSQTLSGPSPVGGAAGGRSSQVVQTLDEFEFQAAHYNIACAYACLGQVADAVANLQKSFEYGFDNLKACRVDPDLRGIQGTAEFEELMTAFDPSAKKGMFNPFKFFG